MDSNRMDALSKTSLWSSKLVIFFQSEHCLRFGDPSKEWDKLPIPGAGLDCQQQDV